MRVANGIPLGRSLLLPFSTENSVQALKVIMVSVLTMNTAIPLHGPKAVSQATMLDAI
jgi:hypothetical protein